MMKMHFFAGMCKLNKARPIHELYTYRIQQTTGIFRNEVFFFKHPIPAGGIQ